MSNQNRKRLSAAAISLIAIALLTGCVKPEWSHFRYSAVRQGGQFFESVLNNPAKVATLHTGWASPFHPSGAGFFTSSPVVYNGKIYIGNSNGFFYAIDAATGAQVWQFPTAGGTPLDSQFHCNPSSNGIASSGAIATIGGVDAVIFGAPDRSSGLHHGDGHLFALNAATGALIWESPAVAQVTGTTSGSTTELHEQIGYSSPLVWFGTVYVGVADHCDNPIQKGKIKAVDLATGNLKAGFNFDATGTRGGGVWSSPTAFNGLLVTTGNTRFGAQPEPVPNNGLSMLRLDLNTGAVVWKHQPVPFSMDNDPDWSATPAITWPSCGTVAISTQKDGWTWAVDETSANPPPAPSVRWAFPPGPWSTSGFHPPDGTVHGDTDYKRPGTSWGDVFVGTMGGFETVSNLDAGLTRLHALNICSSDAQRVRWIKDIPGTSGPTYALGPPTVAGGIFYVGTAGGHVVAVADPSIKAALGNRCEDPAIPNVFCGFLGHRLVPDPWIKDVTLPGGSSDAIFGEPVIVDGHIYVATWAGNVYMLQP